MTAEIALEVKIYMYFCCGHPYDALASVGMPMSSTGESTEGRLLLETSVKLLAFISLTDA